MGDNNDQNNEEVEQNDENNSTSDGAVIRPSVNIINETQLQIIYAAHQKNIEENRPILTPYRGMIRKFKRMAEHKQHIRGLFYTLEIGGLAINRFVYSIKNTAADLIDIINEKGTVMIVNKNRFLRQPGSPLQLCRGEESIRREYHQLKMDIQTMYGFATSSPGFEKFIRYNLSDVNPGNFCIAMIHFNFFRVEILTHPSKSFGFLEVTLIDVGVDAKVHFSKLYRLIDMFSELPPQVFDARIEGILNEETKSPEFLKIMDYYVNWSTAYHMTNYFSFDGFESENLPSVFLVPVRNDLSMTTFIRNRLAESKEITNDEAFYEMNSEERALESIHYIPPMASWGNGVDQIYFQRNSFIPVRIKSMNTGRKMPSFILEPITSIKDTIKTACAKYLEDTHINDPRPPECNCLMDGDAYIYKKTEVEDVFSEEIERAVVYKRQKKNFITHEQKVSIYLMDTGERLLVSSTSLRKINKNLLDFQPQVVKAFSEYQGSSSREKIIAMLEKHIEEKTILLFKVENVVFRLGGYYINGYFYNENNEWIYRC